MRRRRTNLWLNGVTVVTLLLSLAVAALWLRSRYVGDCVAYATGGGRLWQVRGATTWPGTFCVTTVSGWPLPGAWRREKTTPRQVVGYGVNFVGGPGRWQKTVGFEGAGPRVMHGKAPAELDRAGRPLWEHVEMTRNGRWRRMTPRGQDSAPLPFVHAVVPYWVVFTLFAIVPGTRLAIATTRRYQRYRNQWEVPPEGEGDDEDER